MKKGQELYQEYAKARNAAGLCDYQVAKRAGLRPGVLTDWKRGRYTPKIDKLLKIGKQVGMTLDQLV